MEQVISTKNSNFISIRENNYFYVDKTNFIKEWWENAHVTTLIMRPPNFGKTLNLRMVESFFSNWYKGRSDLFEGLSIWKEEKYRKLQGSYPVIYLSFEGIKANTFNAAKECIVQRMVQVRDTFRFITESENTNHYRIDFFAKDVFTTVDVQNFLEHLSFHLYNYYNKRVIILLDDFDVPLQEAYKYKYWDEMIYFMSVLLLSTFKVNRDLERGLITGVTGRGFGSQLCDVNNLNINTTLSKRYATSFGFTEDEVFRALDKCGLSNKKEEIKEWYGGFTFGECKGSIYNPSSIVNFINSGEFKIYCTNTTLDYLISELLHKSYYENDIKNLLAGESIYTSLDEEIIFNKCKQSLWSFLFAFGYLSVIDSYYKQEYFDEIFLLKISNKETLLYLESMLSI